MRETGQELETGKGKEGQRVVETGKWKEGQRVVGDRQGEGGAEAGDSQGKGVAEGAGGSQEAAGGLQAVVDECERGLGIAHPVDPATELLQEEHAGASEGAAARIAAMQGDLWSLRQRANLSLFFHNLNGPGTSTPCACCR